MAARLVRHLVHQLATHVLQPYQRGA